MSRRGLLVYPLSRSPGVILAGNWVGVVERVRALARNHAATSENEQIYMARLGHWRHGSFAGRQSGRGLRHMLILPVAMAWRTWPLAFFRAAWAWGRVTPAASITRATGVRLPEAFRASAADS